MGLLESPIVGIVIGLAGIVVALAQYVACKKKNKFKYYYNSFTLIRNRKTFSKPISIKYKGGVISELTVSKIAIWYGGSGAVSRSDLAERNPLSIKLIDDDASTSILDASVLESSSNAIDVEIADIDSGKVEFSFDYIDRNAGFVVEILHTGHSDDLILDYRMKNGKRAKRIGATGKIDPKNKKRIRKASIVMFAILTIIIVIFTITLIYLFVSNQLSIIFLPNQEPFAIMTLIVMIIYSIVTTSLTFSMFAQEYRLDIPSSLRRYLDFE